MDKFDGGNFHLWKFKMEMLLASKDLWDIVDGSEEAPEEDSDPKMKKAYQRRAKLALSIIATNLVDKQAAHIQHCRDPAKAWIILCGVHEQKSLSNILFVRRKFFTIKMQDGDDMLDHINKVKALADQLSCLDVPLRDEDVVMTLLQSLPDAYDYLIAALESRPIKDLTLEYVTARLMHEITKRKEKDPHHEDSALVLRQGKTMPPSSRPNSKTCFV
ncbi:MAG: retrotransposon gag domain-containing protein, partial [bacterium]